MGYQNRKRILTEAFAIQDEREVANLWNVLPINFVPKPLYVNVKPIFHKNPFNEEGLISQPF